MNFVPVSHLILPSADPYTLTGDDSTGPIATNFPTQGLPAVSKSGCGNPLK